MGFTLKCFLYMFGFFLVISTIPTSAESQNRKRTVDKVPCVWSCPIIFDRCLLKGRGRSMCNKVAQTCNLLCLVEEPLTMDSKNKRFFNGRQECKQVCFGLFQQCGTLTTTIEAHKLCVRAKTRCFNRC